MARPKPDSFVDSWNFFVHDVCDRIDTLYFDEHDQPKHWPVWRKADGSQVSALDLHFDVAIRESLAHYFPTAAVLSEEIGLLNPPENDAHQLAIVDPIDGTESLVNGLHRWWVSVGLRRVDGQQVGLVYQPSTRRLHDSTRPKGGPQSDFIVGMSPDRLTSDSTNQLRERLVAAGAKLTETPHAVEKIAAVIEGRAMATVYLPSKKSPAWHSWDLAAGVALAEAHRLSLSTLDGNPLEVDARTSGYESAWICAVDDHAWHAVRALL